MADTNHSASNIAGDTGPYADGARKAVLGYIDRIIDEAVKTKRPASFMLISYDGGPAVRITCEVTK